MGRVKINGHYTVSSN